MSLNILYAYHTHPDYMPPAQFSPQQVNCGPYYENKTDETGRVVSLKTPIGYYDLAPILAQLPAAQQPDLFVVKADASRQNFPTNLAALSCPKVLIVGDTQHMQIPIRTMVHYACSEPFDVVITDHIRRNLHFFGEVGLPKTYWLPAVNLTIFPDLPRSLQRPLAFVGQMGKHHPVRVQFLKHLMDNGYPLHLESGSQRRAAEIYASSQINLNCSLNGDINLRIFEIIAHGGFLLTDWMKPQAGLEYLLTPNKDFAYYADPHDLGLQVERYLHQPELCQTIAENAHQRFLHEHHPDIRRQQLLDIVEGRPVPEYFYGDYDPRSWSLPKLTIGDLFQVISCYEVLQVLNRGATAFNVLFSRSVSPRLPIYACDLSHFGIAQMVGEQGLSPAANEAYTTAQVKDLIGTVTAAEAQTVPWNVIVVHQNDLTDTDFINVLGASPVVALFVEDYHENKALEDFFARRLDITPYLPVKGMFLGPSVRGYVDANI